MESLRTSRGQYKDFSLPYIFNRFLVAKNSLTIGMEMGKIVSMSDEIKQKQTNKIEHC